MHFQDVLKDVKAGAVTPEEVAAAFPAAKAAAAASRTRPLETITFPNPVTGPSGQQLVAYTWERPATGERPAGCAAVDAARPLAGPA